MGQYDITIASANPAPSFAATSFRVADGAIRQDITPASTRRSDGDTRFLTIPTESYWGQNDWSAGPGRDYPADPTSAYTLLSSVADNGRLTAPYGPQGFTSGLPGHASTSVKWLLAHLGVLYAWAFDGGAGADRLYKNTAGTWAAIYTFPQAPTCLTSFRGDIWASYGPLFATEKITPAGANTNMGFNSQITCPYGSMIFYCRYDLSSDTYRLNRYDPENVAAVPDLAIFPKASTQPPRGMAALGPDLYIAFNNELWRFASPNGNSGILQGPVDRWVGTGPSGGFSSSTPGRHLVAFQGALYWSTGATLRHYLPGGQGRTIWPVAGYDYEMGRNGARVIAALCAIDDRLYALGSYTQSATTVWHDLWLWTGAGMQRVARIPIVSSGGAISPSSFASLATTGDGKLYWSVLGGGNATLGFRVGYVTTRDAAAIVYDLVDQYVYESSLLDFGMLDIDKAVSRIGVVARVPAGQGLAVYASVDGGAYVQWPQVGAFLATAPSTCYFAPPAGHVAVGKLFRFRIGFAMGGVNASSPEVYAINAIPNPVMPLRRGFRFTVLLDEGTVDHDGGALYADEAAVEAARDLVRQFRTEEHPLLLTWTDGEQYYVRCNTQTEKIAWTQAGRRPVYRITLDCQEVT